MTTQAQPPSEAQQLADARIANDLLRTRLAEQEQIVADQRTTIAELTQLVGAETPIAACTLAQSWHAEKAHMMDYIEAQRTTIARLTAEIDALRAACDVS
jgi:hypothetical protein